MRLSEGMPTKTSVLQREINGVLYAVFPETITDQVYDADGIDLTTILANLVSSKELDPIKAQLQTFTNVYRLRGILENDPSTSAIDKLYMHTGMEVGDVYLVQANTAGETVVLEQYLYSGAKYGWVYLGSSGSSSGGGGSTPGSSHTHSNKAVLDLIPSIVDRNPGDVLMIAEDGTTLKWDAVTGGTSSIAIEEHNADPEAHQDIRDLIAGKADTPIGYNDILSKDNWTLSPNGRMYIYQYTNYRIASAAYFTINPIEDEEGIIARTIRKARINSSYVINTDDPNNTYAVLTAMDRPDMDIPIFVLLQTQIDQQ